MAKITEYIDRGLNRNDPHSLEAALSSKIYIVDDLRRNDLNALADWFDGYTRH